MTLPPSETALLDVGCNVGTFLEQARTDGFRVTGVEPDASAVRAAASSLDIRCSYLHEAGFSDQSFDVITLFEVIEHLTAPVALLAECHRILKTSGFMVITTGNTRSWTAGLLKENWDYFDLARGHISFFNPGSIKKLAEESHFRVVKVETKSVSARTISPICGAERIARKIVGEALNLPAKILKQGHDLFVVLRKSAQGD